MRFAARRTGLHGGVIVLRVAGGDAGVLIVGAPGRGKTRLALALSRRCAARLVTDDLTCVVRRGPHLYGAFPARAVAAPHRLEGEARPRGGVQRRLVHASRARIDVVVSLDPAARPDRTARILGLRLALITRAGAAHARRARPGRNKSSLFDRAARSTGWRAGGRSVILARMLETALRDAMTIGDRPKTTPRRSPGNAGRRA